MSNSARLRRITAHLGPLGPSAALPRRYFNVREGRYYEAHPITLGLEAGGFEWDKALAALSAPWAGFDLDGPPKGPKAWTRAELEAMAAQGVEVYVRPRPFASDPLDLAHDVAANDFRPLRLGAL